MVAIRGQEDVKRVMSELAAAPARVLDAGCVAALTPMRNRIADNARPLRQPHTPKGGHLDEGVAIGKISAKGKYFRVFWVAFTKRARALAHLVEFGTAPHWQPRWRGGWMHPGARPKPFARPGFEETKDGVAAILGQYLWAGITQSIRGVKK
jgi:hypothetical protein